MNKIYSHIHFKIRYFYLPREVLFKLGSLFHFVCISNSKTGVGFREIGFREGIPGVARVPRRHARGSSGFREGMRGVAKVPRRHARGSSGFREGMRGVARVPRRHTTGTKGSVRACEELQGFREGIPRVQRVP